MITRSFKAVLAASLALSLFAACGGGGADVEAGVPPVQPEAAALTGMNLPQLSYWDRSFAMADVVRQSRFTNIAAPEGARQDAEGAPRGDFNLFLTSTAIGAGTYKLVFAGQATLGIAAQPAGRIENQRYDAAANRTTADLVLPGGSTDNTWVEFRNTRRGAGSAGGDGVTDLHLWRPGYPTDGSVIFTREFIEAMRKVQILRAMDTTSTNDNPTVHWSERTPAKFLGMTEEKGQSWEMLIQLANATSRDLWINVPIKADDGYITRLAQLFRYGSDGVNPYTSEQSQPVYPPLRGDLKLYVEYGNEIWNFSGGFYNFGWARDLSNVAFATPGHPVNYDGKLTSPSLARFIGYRSAFISQTFRSVWGDGAMMSRVRPILATQTGNANGYLSNALLWAEGYYGLGNVSKIWWGGGGATYYESTVASSDTQPATMQAYFDGLPNPQYAQRIQADTTWLKAYGLRNIAYEGGPEPGIGKSDAVASAYNTDPRMPARMAVAYDIFKANGGDAQVYYNYSGMGAPWWFIDGTKQLTASDTTSPKMRFLDTLASRPEAAPTLGTAVPATIYLRDVSTALQTYTEGGSSWGYNGTAYRIQDITNSVSNEMLLVPVRAASAGRYAVSVTTADTPAGARVQLFVNGALAGELVPGASTTAGSFVASNELQVNLPAGISVLRLRAAAGKNIWLRDLAVRVAD